MKLARASQVRIEFDASNALVRLVGLKRRSHKCQVPENTKFSKDVILAILKASTVFVNYLGAPPLLESAIDRFNLNFNLISSQLQRKKDIATSQVP